MRTQQSGFTLIELISVIVILGILSAFAIPRFANLEDEARRASVEGLGGAIRSASALVHAVWLANGSVPSQPVVLEGQSVDTNATGYPDGVTAIQQALQDDPVNHGYVLNGNAFSPQGANTPANCSVTYTSAASPPTIQVDPSNCN